MIEAEWRTSTDLPYLIKQLRENGKDRKLRLFACACARRLWDLFPSGNARKAVEVAERFADGAATAHELAEVYDAGMKAWSEARLAWAVIVSGGMSVAIEDASGAALYTAMHVPDAKISPGIPHRTAAKAQERRALLALLRDIFGDLFRAVRVEPSWLRWNGGAVPKLAQAIYDDRAFAHLPILADALEEAGCDNPDILAHCRSGGEHVRGCWVVDLLLGKA
jgi:hypothetical protein